MQGKKVSETADLGRAEQISSLIDGELDQTLTHQLFTTLCQDPDARKTWMRMHLVADALRSSEVAARHSEHFCARVSAALQNEATVLAPRAKGTTGLKRYLIPGLALAASVAAITFVALPLLGPVAPESGKKIAAASIAPAVILPSEDVARRAASTVASARALDPYLAAHRELTATGVALPRATPYLRPAAELVQGR
jgi:negative regulator of sigma E activity